MKWRKVSRILRAFLLIGFLVSVISIQPVRTNGTTYVKADGSTNHTTMTVDSGGTFTAYYDIIDVAITEVEPSKTVVGQGYTVHVMVTVENQGNSPITFNVTAYYGGTAILTERWSDGASSNTFWSMGDVNRDGYIDRWDVYLIAEAFGWSGLPGKNPADINSDGAVNYEDLYTCSHNYGRNIWTTLGLPKLVKDHATVTLPSGYVALIAFRWNTTGVVKGNYTIHAYAWPVLGETDTEDNTIIDGIIKVGIPGDVDPVDDYVGIDDIFNTALRFGAELGGPPNPNGYYYSPVHDIVYDCYNGIDDIYIAASHFGEEDP